MNRRSIKMSLSLASSALLLVASSAFADSHETFLQDSSGAAVRDSAGDCVLVNEGLGIPECLPEQAAAPAPAPQSTGSTVSLSADAFFDFDRASLKSSGESELGNLVGQMSGSNVRGIDIVGHTDSVGSDAYNQNLSEKRARSVADYLVGRGVDAGMITTSGAGESSPVASNDNAEGRAQNRRVDVTVDAVTGG